MPNFIQNFKFFGIEYEFISEIYGKNLSDKELEKSVYDYKNCFITLGKIGCALSHLKIYQKMLDENIPYALILEDNAIFTQDTLKYIRKIDEFLKRSDFKLLLLMHQGDEWFGNLNIKINDEINLYKLSKGTGAYGYILTQGAAKKLLKTNTPLILQADYWVQFHKFSGLKIYCLDKNIIKTINESGGNSSIGDDRHRLSKEKSHASKRRLRKFGGIKYLLVGLRYRVMRKIFAKYLIKGHKFS